MYKTVINEAVIDRNVVDELSRPVSGNSPRPIRQYKQLGNIVSNNARIREAWHAAERLTIARSSLMRIATIVCSHSYSVFHDGDLLEGFVRKKNLPWIYLWCPALAQVVYNIFFFKIHDYNFVLVSREHKILLVYRFITSIFGQGSDRSSGRGHNIYPPCNSRLKLLFHAVTYSHVNLAECARRNCWLMERQTSQ